ncbi:hypothetical protein BOO86_21300 [Mycobacterium sp. CBMA 234]|uniref:hypothetical protein n=1 Tax=Mycolicibacterium sp. CBMA 234 TaxID=1918495 RepID=UPI0012DEBECF|nr:hypothetical protein [Mycolicibacterium sp. CBMA 234]MUL67024.1 hypothetical protein [Mycolicibacterium sp. CBMA 234]
MDDEHADQPVSLELLADLQAGLLDDATATQLRQRIRDDPAVARQYAELEQVRHDLKDLADNPAPSDIPAAVTEHIGAALRGAQPARHAVVPGRGVHASRSAVIAAAAAGLVAVGIGAVVVLSQADAPATMSTGPSVASLTVQRQAGMPWSDRQILGLLSKQPELGPLTGPGRLQPCLKGLGYSPTTQVLGAATLTVHDRDEVIMLLPGTDHGSVMALVVSPGCSSTDAGLIADAVIVEPSAASAKPSR